MKDIKTNDNNVYKIALLVSLACVLQIAESLIPHPIPGLRLGLANIITLIALINLGFGYALEITVLRTVLSSFMIGTFMSPGFVLSFASGIMSTITMGFLYWLAHAKKQHLFSIVGISIVGALMHNVTQLSLAYFIMIKHTGIFIFLPWLSIGAVFIGWFTGIVSARICLRLKEERGKNPAIKEVLKGRTPLLLNHYTPGESLIHRLPPEIKIASIIILSLAVLIINSYWFYASLFIFFMAVTVISRTSFNDLFLSARRSSSLIFASFLFPVFFNSGKHVLSRFIYCTITTEGLNTGIIFALRIICLILASSLLSRTTSPEDLTRGLARVLSPLRPLGISGKRAAMILSLSWRAVPVFWEMAKHSIRKMDLKKIKSPRNLTVFMSDIITNLYLETDDLTDSLKGFYREEPASLRKEAAEIL